MKISLTWVAFYILSIDIDSPLESFGENTSNLVEWVLGISSLFILVLRGVGDVCWARNSTKVDPKDSVIQP